MKPPLLIVNPTCGKQDPRTLPQVLAGVERTLGDVVIRYTARRGHAEELAREAAGEGHSLIVAVGGDGTLSEVVNGVLSAADARLVAEPPVVGLIDAGTGGDFRRSLGIGAGYERSLEALALERVRFVDVGKATFPGPSGQPMTHYFVNVISAGLGGRVDHYIERIPGFVGGKTAYYMASLWAVVTGSEQPVLARITWNGETRDEVVPAFLVAVCNGRWFGGGMDLAPMALPDDGRLEVVTITERNKLFLLAKTRTIYAGRHLDEPTVTHFPCERIELRLESEPAQRRYLLDVDGDALGSLPLTIEVQKQRLPIRA